MENRPLALDHTTPDYRHTPTINSAMVKTVRPLHNNIDRFDACSATIKLRPAVISAMEAISLLDRCTALFGEADRAMRPNQAIRGLYSCTFGPPQTN